MYAKTLHLSLLFGLSRDSFRPENFMNLVKISGPLSYEAKDFGSNERQQEHKKLTHPCQILCHPT